MHTLRPTIASKIRSSSGKDQWASSSSLVGTFSFSYDLYAMATQRRLSAAMSSIAFLKNDICKTEKLYTHAYTHTYILMNESHPYNSYINFICFVYVT